MAHDCFDYRFYLSNMLQRFKVKHGWVCVGVGVGATGDVWNGELGICIPAMLVTIQMDPDPPTPLGTKIFISKRQV